MTAPDGTASKVFFIHAGQHDDGKSYFLGRGQGERYPEIGAKCDLETTTRGAVSGIPVELYDKLERERTIAPLRDVVVLSTRC